MIGFFAVSPCFGGDGKIASNFAKNLTCPHLASWLNQMAQRVKTGKYFSKGGIITLLLVRNNQVCLQPVLGELYEHTRWGTEETAACCELIRNSRRLVDKLMIIALYGCCLHWICVLVSSCLNIPCKTFVLQLVCLNNAYGNILWTLQ